MSESREVPPTEKISVCALYGAQEYRQVLALKFRLGQQVRAIDFDDYRFLIRSVGLDDHGRIVYFAYASGRGYTDEELEAVEPAAAQENRIDVIVFPVGKAPRIESVENTLETFQKLVDGHIECVALPLSGGLTLICNEEGKLQGLPGNGFLRDARGVIRDTLCGGLVVVRGKGEEFACVLEGDLSIASILIRGSAR